MIVKVWQTSKQTIHGSFACNFIVMKRFLLSFSFLALVFNAFSQNCTHHCHNHAAHSKNQAKKELVEINKNWKKRTFKTNGLIHFIGSTHQHSGFSDGYPGTTPADYFQSGIDKGFDFVFGADHSDSYIIPVTLHDECASENILDCIAINPLDLVGSVLKWPKFAEIAKEKTNENFLAVRGFEWTSDRFGHINVYFSKHISNAKTDGGYVLLETFWNWFTTDPVNIFGLEAVLGGYGASDGLGVFNHPGDKSLFDEDPGFNWNGFEYVPKADSQMVGMEVFNDGRDYASDGRAYFQEALDLGWHIGAIASEDHHDTDWNNDENEKTIVVAKDLTEASFKEAMKRRRTYAVRDFSLRLEYFAGDAFMGSQIQRKTDSQVLLNATVDTDQKVKIEIVSNGNTVVDSVFGKRIQKIVDVTESEKWYYLRVSDANTGRSLAYSSPIWIKGGGDIVDEINTSVVEASKQEFLVYPNPVSRGNRVFFNARNLVSVSLFSADGKLIKTTNENSIEMDVESGIYICRLFDGESVVSKVVEVK